MIAMHSRSVFLRFPWNRIRQYSLLVQAWPPTVGVPRDTALSLETLEVTSSLGCSEHHECYVLCDVDKGWFGWLSGEEV